MKRILITGAAGFLGSHLCDRFIKEGYYADLAIVNPNSPWEVNKENILYKCGWSPFEGTRFQSKITHTLVNGQLVYENGKVNDIQCGERLLFER